MRALLRSLIPERFEDLSAVLALYRPGPMSANMHNDFADFKNKRKKNTYFHPDAEETLGDTFGLMIYQESLMRVAQKFAGYSLAEADNLRKACAKKVPKLMEEQRETFETESWERNSSTSLSSSPTTHSQKVTHMAMASFHIKRHT
jgi:DNA polymerase-3 subunit alpha